MTDKQKTLSKIAIIVLLVSSLLAIICACSNAVNSMEEKREQELRCASQVVKAATVNSFIKPLTVAEVMSNDAQLKSHLEKAKTDPEGEEAEMTEYLSSLKDGMGYKMMFAVCDASGAYYTCEGITQYINKDDTGNCLWYGEFLNTGKDVEFNVDLEESTGWELSVFVNQLIKDNRSDILGVVGTAVEMSQLQSLLEQYERIYKVKIDITDANGIIQIDTDTTKLQQEYPDLPDFDLFSDGEIYYQKSDSGDIAITYMEDIDMYLVVANAQSEAVDLVSTLVLPIMFWLIGVLAAVGFRIYSKRG